MSILSFADLLQTQAEPAPENHPVAWTPVRHGDPVTYYLQDFQADVQRLIARFANTPDVCANSAAILYATHSYHFAVAFTALVILRKTIVLPHSGNAGAIAQLSGDYPIAVVDADVYHQLEDSGADITGFNLDRALAETSPLPEKPVTLPTDCHDVGIVIFTSGSTGAPKAIHKTLGHFLAEVASLESLWGESIGDSRLVATVSHQHVYGLLFRLLWPLLTRRPLCAVAFQYPEELLWQLATGQPMVLISSPAFLSRLPDHVSADALPANSQLKKIVSSGGPLKPQDSFAVQPRLKAAVTEVFGSSETGGVGYRERTSETDSMAWTPLPRVQVTTAPETRQLLIRSPYCFTRDWYAMGDVATLQDNQCFVINGRADRIVKIEEKRISLDEIEARLNQTRWVDSCRVLLLQGQRTEVAAVLVLNEQGKNRLQQNGKLALTRQLRQELAHFLDAVVLPRKWRILDELPLNSQGKLVQSTLENLFAQRNTPDNRTNSD